MTNINLKDLVDSIVSGNEELASKKQEITVILRDLLSQMPNVEIDAKFEQKLRTKILAKIYEKNLINAKTLENQFLFYKTFKNIGFIFSGAGISVLCLFILNYYGFDLSRLGFNAITKDNIALQSVTPLQELDLKGDIDEQEPIPPTKMLMKPSIMMDSFETEDKDSSYESTSSDDIVEMGLIPLIEDDDVGISSNEIGEKIEYHTEVKYIGKELDLSSYNLNTYSISNKNLYNTFPVSNIDYLTSITKKVQSIHFLSTIDNKEYLFNYSETDGLLSMETNLDYENKEFTEKLTDDRYIEISNNFLTTIGLDSFVDLGSAFIEDSYLYKNSILVRYPKYIGGIRVCEIYGEPSDITVSIKLKDSSVSRFSSVLLKELVSDKFELNNNFEYYIDLATRKAKKQFYYKNKLLELDTPEVVFVRERHLEGYYLFVPALAFSIEGETYKFIIQL